MGLRKHPQPRHGSDAFGPGALPRRAVPVAPAPWRRPLAALVLAGGIGSLGLNTLPAQAAQPDSGHSCSKSHRSERSSAHGRNEDRTQRPKRAASSQHDDDRRSSKPRRANTSASDSSSSKSTSSGKSNSSRKSNSSNGSPTAPNASNDGAAMPLASGTYRVGAYFGKTGNWSRYHTGQDFSAATGTPVYAVTSGKVVAGKAGSWAGTYVAIQAADGSSTLYAHLNSKEVSVGQTVKAGDKIGEVGSTGRAFGSHLHFEYYPAGVTPGDVYSATDPMDYLNRLGIGM